MISKKEIVAILMFITALICILNATLFGNVVPTTTSYEQLFQQSISASTAYICILYGLSTWLYHSNYSEPRHHIRIVFLAMLLVLIISNFAAFVLNLMSDHFSKVIDSIDISEINTDFAMNCRIITLVLTDLTIVLLVIVFVYLCRITVKKHNEFTRRIQNIA